MTLGWQTRYECHWPCCRLLASHPIAICSCLNAMETTDKEYPSCPNTLTSVTQPSNPSTSFACSSETLISTPSHTASKSLYLVLGSQHHYNKQSILPMNTPSSTPAVARNTTAPITTRCPNTQTSPAQDSPCLPSSPSALKMASYLSRCTP